MTSALAPPCSGPFSAPMAPTIVEWMSVSVAAATRAELGDLQSQLVAARALPEPIIRLMRSLPAGNGMDLLRTLTSALGHYDADASDNSPQANYRKAVRLTAQIGSLVATLGRMSRGQGPIEPDPVLGHAANFLYMLTGERPKIGRAHV